MAMVTECRYCGRTLELRRGEYRRLLNAPVHPRCAAEGRGIPAAELERRMFG